MTAHAVRDDEKTSAGMMRLPLFVSRRVGGEVLIFRANKADVRTEHGANDKATGRAGLL
jgi:hypothetical protein